LALNKEIRFQMSEQAYRTAQNNTWEAASEKMRNIYESQMENKCVR
jgi:hypothetical protein